MLGLIHHLDSSHQYRKHLLQWGNNYEGRFTGQLHKAPSALACTAQVISPVGLHSQTNYDKL